MTILNYKSELEQLGYRFVSNTDYKSFSILCTVETKYLGTW
jgi:hypothetical protein